MKRNRLGEEADRRRIKAKRSFRYKTVWLWLKKCAGVL